MMKTVQPILSYTPDTSVGPSAQIWASCPWTEFQNDPSRGKTTWMTGGNIGTASASGAAYAGQIGAFTGYMYQGGQINDAQVDFGAVKLSSDGDNEGVTIMESQAGKYRLVTPSTLALGKKMWFEASIAKSSVASAHLTAFVGLMAPTLSSGLPAAAQPLTTTDDTPMTAGDLFGFLLTGTTSTRGGPTEVGSAFCLASGTVNYPTNCQTMMADTNQTVLAADTYVKVGFIFDPKAESKQITKATARQTAGNTQAALLRFFINGVELPAFLTSSDIANATSGQAFPTSYMTPVVSIMNMASQSSDYLSFRFLRAAQEL